MYHEPWFKSYKLLGECRDQISSICHHVCKSSSYWRPCVQLKVQLRGVKAAWASSACAVWLTHEREAKPQPCWIRNVCVRCWLFSRNTESAVSLAEQICTHTHTSTTWTRLHQSPPDEVSKSDSLLHTCLWDSSTPPDVRLLELHQRTKLATHQQHILTSSFHHCVLTASKRGARHDSFIAACWHRLRMRSEQISLVLKLCVNKHW